MSYETAERLTAGVCVAILVVYLLWPGGSW